jgi:P-type Ca2+ transporter type 2C
LPEAPRPSAFALIERQFASPLIALLAAAAVVSVVASEALDAIVIGAIVVVNAAIGYAQEARAEDAARNLRRLLAPRARWFATGRPTPSTPIRSCPGICSSFRPATA